MSERTLPIEVIQLGDSIRRMINDFEDQNPGVTIGQMTLEHDDHRNAVDDYDTKRCARVLCHAAVVALPCTPQ